MVLPELANNPAKASGKSARLGLRTGGKSSLDSHKGYYGTLFDEAHAGRIPLRMSRQAADLASKNVRARDE
jgi:hypothetical protein